MDSIKEALKHLLIYVPLTVCLKPIEWLGTVYGILQFSFQKGMYKSSKVFDSFKGN